MGGDLVEEEERAPAGSLGDEVGEGQDEADQERLLLAGRGESGGLVLADMGDGKVGAVRAGEGAAGGGVAGAAGGQVWMTGTEPGLFAGIGAEASWFEVADGAVRAS